MKIPGIRLKNYIPVILKKPFYSVQTIQSMGVCYNIYENTASLRILQDYGIPEINAKNPQCQKFIAKLMLFQMISAFYRAERIHINNLYVYLE